MLFYMMLFFNTELMATYISRVGIAKSLIFKTLSTKQQAQLNLCGKDRISFHKSLAPNTFVERTSDEHPPGFYMPIELANHCRRQALLFGFD